MRKYYIHLGKLPSLLSLLSLAKEIEIVILYVFIRSIAKVIFVFAKGGK